MSDSELAEKVRLRLLRYVDMCDTLRDEREMVTEVLLLIDEEVKPYNDEMQRMAASMRAIRAGHTKTVEYDLSPAMVESALRQKLIDLGWTPPKG